MTGQEKIQPASGQSASKATGKETKSKKQGSFDQQPDNKRAPNSSKSAGKVPEITTSSAPEDDIRAEGGNGNGTNPAELLKDEEYVEKLADSLSKRLEKTRGKIKKRGSEMSLIKASPDSKNPSVILSCASSDEEDEPPPPANPESRASLTADQPSTSTKLFRGLKKKLSREKKEIPKVKPEVSVEHAAEEKNQPSTSKPIVIEESPASSAPSSPTPPGSDYETSLTSHRGSWSTLLHAIGTAGLVQKVQRSALDIKQEKDVEELKKSLDVHVSGNYQIMYGPVLPIWQAVLVLILNFFLPGTGTILSGFLLVSKGTYRTAEVKGKHALVEHFVIVIVIGVSQMMTITFLLIGWFWALVWGAWVIQLSMEHQKLVNSEKIIASHEQGGRMSIQESVNHPNPALRP